MMQVIILKRNAEGSAPKKNNFVAQKREKLAKFMVKKQ